MGEYLIANSALDDQSRRNKDRMIRLPVWTSMILLLQDGMEEVTNSRPGKSGKLNFAMYGA